MASSILPDYCPRDDTDMSDRNEEDESHMIYPLWLQMTFSKIPNGGIT